MTVTAAQIRKAKRTFGDYVRARLGDCAYSHDWEEVTSSEPTAAGMHIESFWRCNTCGAIRED